MKVVVLGTRGFPGVQGGVETHCENLYPILVSLGCDVQVLARQPYVGKEKYEYRHVSVLPLTCPKNKFLETIWHTLIGIFKARRMKPDILHIHAIGPSICVPFARLLGMNVVMTHHGPDYQRKKWNWFAKWILKSGEYAGVLWANQVITISQTISEHVQSVYGKETTVIPNGVVIPSETSQSDSISKYGLVKGKYILAVGRLVPEKGFHDLIEAFALVQDTLPVAMKLVVVGDADHEDHYSRELKAASCKIKNVILTGRLKGQAVWDLYQNAGLFVLPSYYEGLPIVLLEALSCALPCLVSDIPANREVELEEKCYFPAGNISALAEKILKQKELTEEMKREQRILVEKKYSWQKVAEKTINVYKLVNNNKRE